MNPAEGLREWRQARQVVCFNETWVGGLPYTLKTLKALKTPKTLVTPRNP